MTRTNRPMLKKAAKAVQQSQYRLREANNKIIDLAKNAQPKSLSDYSFKNLNNKMKDLVNSATPGNLQDYSLNNLHEKAVTLFNETIPKKVEDMIYQGQTAQLELLNNAKALKDSIKQDLADAVGLTTSALQELNVGEQASSMMEQAGGLISQATQAGTQMMGMVPQILDSVGQLAQNLGGQTPSSGVEGATDSLGQGGGGTQTPATTDSPLPTTQTGSSPATNPTTTPTNDTVISSATPTSGITQTDEYSVTCYEADGWHKNYSSNPTKVASGTLQKEVHDKYVADGARYSKEGVAVLNVDGEDRYLVAVTPKYGKVGDKIDVVTADGTVIKCVVADEKGSDATHVDGHVDGGKVNIVELEVSTDVANTHIAPNGGHYNPGSPQWPLPWDATQDVVRIDNYGSIILK